MDHETYLDILGQGVGAWNRWRKAYPGIRPDLSGADLAGVDLVGARMHNVRLIGADLYRANLEAINFNAARLTEANLAEANLAGVNLEDANLGQAFLASADLRGANLTGTRLHSADLRGADLRRANLSFAELRGTHLDGADLRYCPLIRSDLREVSLVQTDLSRSVLVQARLSNARLGATTFQDTNLRGAQGLESCQHLGPSWLDHHTLRRSGGLPPTFMRGCGWPDWLMALNPLLDPEATPATVNQSGSQMVQQRLSMPPLQVGCFLSYSPRDQAFARRLHDALQAQGIRCWLTSHTQRLETRQAARLALSLDTQAYWVLLLSQATLSYAQIQDEVEEAFAQEVRENRTVLVALQLDDAVMENPADWLVDIWRTRRILDFRCDFDVLPYRSALEQLLWLMLKGAGR